MDNKYHIIISVYNRQSISVYNRQSVDIIANDEYSKDKIIEAFNDSHIKVITISCVKINNN